MNLTEFAAYLHRSPSTTAGLLRSHTIGSSTPIGRKRDVEGPLRASSVIWPEGTDRAVVEETGANAWREKVGRNTPWVIPADVAAAFRAWLGEKGRERAERAAET